MATKIPARRRAAGQHTDAWRGLPASVEKLGPADIEQAAARHAELAESGELISAQDLAERLHMSPQAASRP